MDTAHLSDLPCCSQHQRLHVQGIGKGPGLLQSKQWHGGHIVQAIHEHMSLARNNTCHIVLPAPLLCSESQDLMQDFV